MAITAPIIRQISVTARIPSPFETDPPTMLFYLIVIEVEPAKPKDLYRFRSFTVDLVFRPKGELVWQGRQQNEVLPTFASAKALRNWLITNYSPSRIRDLYDPEAIYTNGNGKDKALRQCFDEVLDDVRRLGEEFEKK